MAIASWNIRVSSSITGTSYCRPAHTSDHIAAKLSGKESARPLRQQGPGGQG
jgi:hypothetical protein